MAGWTSHLTKRTITLLTVYSADALIVGLLFFLGIIIPLDSEQNAVDRRLSPRAVHSLFSGTKPISTGLVLLCGLLQGSLLLGGV